MDSSVSTFSDHNELPKQNFMGVSDLCQFQGFWYPLRFFNQALLAKSGFEARHNDVLLASSMKTGTTWLKALIPTIIHYTTHDHDNDDPLVKNHPNELMPSLEIQVFSGKYTPKILDDEQTPRLFRTHVPYEMLPEFIKNSDGCKIVYVTRDPKDTFVSLWHFLNLKKKQEEPPCPIDEAFERFCEGVHPFGPFHDHVLGYWEASLKNPENILFLKYEEMKADPKGQVKKLASFLGKPLECDEDIEKIVWRCSLKRIKNLEVNKSGLEPWVGLPKSSYFRLGVVGDWKNSLSSHMKNRLDEITRTKFQGTGLEFDEATGSILSAMNKPMEEGDGRTLDVMKESSLKSPISGIKLEHSGPEAGSQIEQPGPQTGSQLEQPAPGASLGTKLEQPGSSKIEQPAPVAPPVTGLIKVDEHLKVNVVKAGRRREIYMSDGDGRTLTVLCILPKPKPPKFQHDYNPPPLSPVPEEERAKHGLPPHVSFEDWAYDPDASTEPEDVDIFDTIPELRDLDKP